MAETASTVSQQLSGKKTYIGCIALIVYGIATFLGWSPDDSAFVDETVGQIEAGIGAIGAFIRMAISKVQNTIAEIKTEFETLKSTLNPPREGSSE